MKDAVKKWGPFCGVLAILLGGLAAFVWVTSRPVSLRAEELSPAETLAAYPGAELTLETTGYQLELTFSNHSDARLESGASVDQNRDLFFDAGLAVLLDGQWYWVPHKDYATAGVGVELEPGDSASGRVVLSPYGKLPDGQYRITFSYWHRDRDQDTRIQAQEYYESYAQFRIEGGRYLL